MTEYLIQTDEIQRRRNHIVHKSNAPADGFPEKFLWTEQQDRSAEKNHQILSCCFGFLRFGSLQADFGGNSDDGPKHRSHDQVPYQTMIGSDEPQSIAEIPPVVVEMKRIFRVGEAVEKAAEGAVGSPEPVVCKVRKLTAENVQ